MSEQRLRPTMEEIQLKEMWGLEHYAGMGYMTPVIWDRLDRLRDMFRNKPNEGEKVKKRCMVGVKTYQNGVDAEVSLFPRSELSDAELIGIAQKGRPDMKWRMELREDEDPK